MSYSCPRCGLLHQQDAQCLALSLPGASLPELPAPGTLLAGRYSIVRVIARGGSSVVFQADDLQAPCRRVALKQLQIDPGADMQARTEAEAWFAREAALLSELRAPGIPAFYSVFREGDHSYLVQEYIEGETLEDLVRREGAVSELQAVAWTMELCHLLYCLHERSQGAVIFRDLKPANILRRARDGRLVVVDFGIARPYQPGQVGTMIGTPGYAPPEQYQGLATPQSDIYALGATLHRLLTGYDPEQGPPFTFPSLRRLTPQIATPLVAIVERALCLDPAARYASVLAMLADLEAVARQHCCTTVAGPALGSRAPVGLSSLAQVRASLGSMIHPLRLGIASGLLSLSCATIAVLQIVPSSTLARITTLPSPAFPSGMLGGDPAVHSWLLPYAPDPGEPQDGGWAAPARFSFGPFLDGRSLAPSDGSGAAWWSAQDPVYGSGMAQQQFYQLPVPGSGEPDPSAAPDDAGWPATP